MKILRIHILPILIAAVISTSLFYLFPINTDGITQTETVGCPKGYSNFYANFDTIPEGINPFVASVRDKEGILLLGSSELTTASPFIPYQFFNERTPFKLVAFGHAFYQSFAMYCNLLAFKGDLSGKKICIILSPGWFESTGTNTESFLEFVRPEMLSNIAKDDAVSVEEKAVIGDYIERNRSLFAGMSLSMEYFTLLNKNLLPFRGEMLKQMKNKIPTYKFDSCVIPNNNPKEWSVPNWSTLQQECSIAFGKSCTNNYQIKDEHFKTILDGATEFKRKEVNPIAIQENQEYEDFKLLVQLLKNSNAKPIFILQGLAPAAYNNLERFDELKQAIKIELENKQFPYLDLFEFNPEKYQPGTLNDLMHMGDYGWNEVNQFIYNQFCYEKVN